MAAKGKVLGKGTDLILTPAQHAQAGDFGTVKKTSGGWQRTFERIHAETRGHNSKLVVRVYPKVLQDLKNWATYKVDGSYQEWCRDVLTANNVSWP
jgi:hypothetical protein